MNKFLAALVLLVAIASSVTAKPRRHSYHGVVARNAADVSAQCPSTNGNGWATHLPNPVDCGSYYVCDWGNAILMPCPAGLHFNPTLQVCDWPQNAGCTAGQPQSTDAPVEETQKPVEPTTAKPEEPKPTTAAPVVTEEPTAEETTKPEDPAEETTQPEEPAEETTQPAGEEEVTEGEQETTQPTEEEEPEVTTQPAEEEQEPEVTTPAEEEEEPEVTTQPPTIEEEVEEEEPAVPECPATGVAILPNPADCETFYVCNNGASFLVTCPEDTAFDRSAATCTEAAEAECQAEQVNP